MAGRVSKDSRATQDTDLGSVQD